MLLLWWVLRDVSAREVIAHLSAARPLPLLAMTATAVLQLFVRAIRWSAVLRTGDRRPGVMPLWHASAIGALANNIIPARVGEVARLYAGARLTGVPLSTVTAATVLERSLDAAIILGLLAIPFLGGEVELSAGQGTAVLVIVRGLGLLAGCLLFVSVVAAAAPERTVRAATRLVRWLLPRRWEEKGAAVVRGAIAGFGVLRNPGQVVRVLWWTVLAWAVNTLSFWFGLLAFNIDAPVGSALLLNGFVSFGVALPSSPGFFGPFEAASRLALELYGVDRVGAVSYAIGYHFLSFASISAFGLWSLRRAHLRLLDVAGARDGDDG